MIPPLNVYRYDFAEESAAAKPQPARISEERWRNKPEWAALGATAAGDLTANVLQMLAAGLGLGVIIQTSGNAFSVIKWLGVAYLVWMGVGKIRTAGGGYLIKGKRTSARSLWFQGFVTSAANPKAVLFFAALFPQTISPDGSFWTQMTILSATYVLLDGFFLTMYGGGARWIARRVNRSAKSGSTAFLAVC